MILVAAVIVVVVVLVLAGRVVLVVLVFRVVLLLLLPVPSSSTFSARAAGGPVSGHDVLVHVVVAGAVPRVLLEHAGLGVHGRGLDVLRGHARRVRRQGRAGPVAVCRGAHSAAPVATHAHANGRAPARHVVRLRGHIPGRAGRGLGDAVAAAARLVVRVRGRGDVVARGGQGVATATARCPGAPGRAVRGRRVRRRGHLPLGGGRVRAHDGRAARGRALAARQRLAAAQHVGRAAAGHVGVLHQLLVLGPPVLEPDFHLENKREKKRTFC